MPKSHNHKLLGNHSNCPIYRERKMRTNFFCTNFFEHPQESGTARQNSREIPDSSLRIPRKTNFRGRAQTFRPPLLRVEDPHHTRRSPESSRWCLENMAGKCLQTRFARHGLTPQRAPRQCQVNGVWRMLWGRERFQTRLAGHG